MAMSSGPQWRKLGPKRLPSGQRKGKGQPVKITVKQPSVQHLMKLLHRALKKAKQFEIRKIARRLKDDAGGAASKANSEKTPQDAGMHLNLCLQVLCICVVLCA